MFNPGNFVRLTTAPKGDKHLNKVGRVREYAPATGFAFIEFADGYKAWYNTNTTSWKFALEEVTP